MEKFLDRLAYIIYMLVMIGQCIGMVLMLVILGPICAPMALYDWASDRVQRKGKV